jgi:hypothetical protein
VVSTEIAPLDAAVMPVVAFPVPSKALEVVYAFDPADTAPVAVLQAIIRLGFFIGGVACPVPFLAINPSATVAEFGQSISSPMAFLAVTKSKVLAQPRTSASPK